MRSSASLPYTPRGAMCKNVCHLRWRQGSGRRAKQHNCSVGSVHVTDCSRAISILARTYMYVLQLYALFRTRLGGGVSDARPSDLGIRDCPTQYGSTTLPLGWSSSTAAISGRSHWQISLAVDSSGTLYTTILILVPRHLCTTYWPPHAGGVLGRRAASSLLPKRELMMK